LLGSTLGIHNHRTVGIIVLTGSHNVIVSGRAFRHDNKRRREAFVEIDQNLVPLKLRCFGV
jgi:hypothetical protein